jgi:hypothetical protein
MAHLNSVPWKKGGRVRVYRCRFCDTYHVGHALTGKKKNG